MKNPSGHFVYNLKRMPNPNETCFRKKQKTN